MTKNILNILILSFFLTSFAGFDTKAQSLSENAEIPKDLVISLERKLHYNLSSYISGKCCDYSLYIKATGDVSLKLEVTLKRKTKNINTKVKREQIKQLIDSFEKVNFFQLQDEYTNGDICKIRATGQSTEIISIQINGNKKKVEHYLGCYIDEKEIITLLLDLGNKIDEIIGTNRWIGR